MKSIAVVLSLIFFIALAAANSLNAALVGYWPMNESSGDTVADLSGNGNNGKILKGGTWTNGMFGSGVMFANGVIEIPHSDTLNVTSPLTLSAWIYPTAFGGWKGIFGKWGGGKYMYSLWLSDNRLVFDIGDASATEKYITSETVLEPNKWTHVTGVSDGTTMKMYINGEEDAKTGATPEMPSHENNLVIGDIDAHPFVGIIDEVRVYDKALERPEIQALMVAPAPVYPSGKLTGTWGAVKSGLQDIVW